MAGFRIAVLPGDGIGVEVVAPTLALLRAACLRTGAVLALEEDPAGAACYRATGAALPAATMAACHSADAILLGAMGDPAMRYPGGTEIAPQLDLRTELGLYAVARHPRPADAGGTAGGRAPLPVRCRRHSEYSRRA